MKVLFTLLASLFCINAMAQLPTTASANLSLWLKADAGVTVNGSNEVTTWSDQSGNSRNAVNSGVTLPTLLPGAINGKPALRFTNDRLETPLIDFTATNAVEVFMVYKTLDNTVALPLEFGDDINTTSTGFYISDHETGCSGCISGVNVAINGDVGYNYNAAPQPSTCFKIVNAAMDKSLTTEEVKIWMNNVLQAKAVGTSNSDNTNNFGNHKLFLGRRNCAACLPPTGEFYLAEVVIYNRTLTTTEKNAVYTYLNGRYNVNNTVNVAGVCQQPALWLKADAGVTTSGTSVTQWADQSGNGNNVIQATTASQPQLQTNVFNGQPAVAFDGINDFLNNTVSNAVTTGAGRTIFVVAKSVCGNTTFVPITIRRSATIASYQMARFVSTNFIYSDGVNSGNNAWAAYSLFDSISAKQSVLTYHHSANGKLNFRFNKTDYAVAQTGNVFSEAGTTGFTIGTREDFGNFTNGYIAEIIVYNSQLNATDIAAVENYLANKYGTNTIPNFAISSKKPVVVSSTSGATVATNINDDNVCTVWGSTSATAQSATINLQTATTVSNVYLNVYNPFTLTNAIIETSPDNSTWTTAATFSGAYSNFANILQTFAPVANVQYIRVRMPTASGVSAPNFGEFIVNPNFINNSLKGLTPMILNAGGNPFGNIVNSGQTLYASKAFTYQWKRNGVDIPGATNQSYTVTNYGNFSVTVTYDICVGACNTALTSAAVTNALVHTSTPTCNIVFDGTAAASVSVPTNALINPTTAFTYEAWFKANANVGINRAIISKGVTTNYAASILLEASTGKIKGEFYTGASLKTLTSLIAYNDNAWHHVAYTYDGANIKLYIDGTLEGTLAATGAVFNATQNFTIGKYSASNAHNFWGSIDEVRVWNTARTQTQINSTIYTQLIGNEANLQAYYNFSDTTYNGQGQLIKNKCTTTGTVLDGFTEGNATYPQYSCSNINLPTAVPPSCNIIFNGTSRVDVGSTGPLTPTGTISFWMKPTVITTYPNPLSLAGASNVGIRFEFNGASLYSVVGSSIGAYTITNILTATQGEWYHISLSWNVAANKIKVYANGKFIQEATNTYWPAGNLNLTLGEGYNGTRYFYGNLDDVALFNTEKTFTEIQQMYLGTAINPADAGLRALYNFNSNMVNGAGVTVNNVATAGGLNGTTVGTCNYPQFSCVLGSSIAFAKFTSASSFYTTNTSSNAVDGNVCTSWTANAIATGNWTVDLETPTTINNMLVILGMSPTNIAWNGFVETSTDGITWTNVYSLNGTNRFNFENVQIQFSNPIPNVRFIKITCTGSASWASLREVLVNQNLINEAVTDMTPILLNADGSFKQGQATIGEVLFSSKATTYQWKRNGVNIAGATNQSYTVTNIGNYSVTVTYACTGSCNANLSTPTVPSGLLPSAIPSCGLVQTGTAAGITIPHNTLINPTTAFTYEAFFRASTDVTVARKILSKGAAANYSVALGLQQTTGKIQAEFVIGGTLRTILSVNAYNDNAWHHVACTYDGANINLYVDGQIDNTLAATGAVAANTSDMEIGRNTDGGGTQPFIGTIDEVRIWNVARTPSQIAAALGAVLVGNESGLQAYYHFNNVLFNGQNRVITNNCSTTGIVLNGISFGTATTPSFTCATPTFTEPDCNMGLTATGNFVTVPHNGALNLFTFSIAAYIKTNQAAAADIHIVSKENAGSQNYRLSINNGKARISFNGGVFTEGITNVNDNMWHYIVGTYDGGTLRIYVDGTQQAGLGTSAAPSNNNDNVIIGQSYTGTNQYIGSLDEISIWNKALSTTEISSNIGNSLAGTEIGLQAYYNFNDNPTDGAAQVVPNKAVATGTTINGTTAGTSTTPVFNCSEVLVNTPTCSIMLNGKDNAIVNNASTVINTSQNYSIEMILKPNSLYEHAGPYYVTDWGSLIQGRLVMGANIGGGNGSGLNISAAANGIGVWAQYGNYNHYRILFYPSLIKDWVHFAVISNNNSLKLFVNGKLVGSVSNAGSTFNISSFLGGGFAGNIAEVRMWDKTLSNDEVHDNINTVYTGAEVGLKTLYRFNSNTLNGANRTVANLGSLGAANALTTRGNTQTPMFTCANYVPNTTDEAVAKPGSGNVFNNYTNGNASMNSWGTMSNTGTIAMWVKAATLTPAVQGIFSTAPLSGNAKGNRGIRLDLESNGYIFVNFGDDNSTTAGTSNRWGITVAPIEINRWYHVAITWNKTTNTWSSIVNGIATQSNVPNTKWPTTFGDVNVGMGFDLGINFNYGQVDELVHYNIALTETQVRDRLARKMTSTDLLWSNLQNYYRFDQSGSGNFYTGTSALYDYKGTKHGIIYAASDFQLSSAPLGDVSAHQYFGVGSGASVAFGTTAKDTITAQVTAGANVQGIQVYGVNEIPNTQAGQFVLANNNRYGGVFVVGDTNQVSYNAKYSYNLNPYFLPAYVHDKLLLYKRDNNAIAGWAVDGSSTIDSINKKYFAVGKSAEFMLGYSPYPVRPRLGNDTTLYVVCDNETYNLLPVYGSKTDGLSTAWNAPNPSAATLGNWRLIATSYFGFKDTAFATIAQDVRVWTGAVSNDWQNVNNWNIPKLPTAITHVIIPVSTPNPCLISTADAFAASMQVQAAGNFNIVAPYNLLISGKCVALPTGP
jgi:Concanavalin A-like lectin/glucanases superfamily/F5/8 type C domain